MAKRNDGEIMISFEAEKETKNTMRYQAVTVEGGKWEDAPVPTLYLTKGSFEKMPDRLVVTITAA